MAWRRSPTTWMLAVARPSPDDGKEGLVGPRHALGTRATTAAETCHNCPVTERESLAVGQLVYESRDAASEGRAQGWRAPLRVEGDTPRSE